MIRYLGVGQVERIHAKLTGGTVAVRSRELLESAVFAPQATMFGEDLVRDLFDKAAVLMRSLAQNQPFVDGNKRTAWVAGLTMLEINGVSIIAAAQEVEALFEELAADSDYLRVAEFLRQHQIP